MMRSFLKGIYTYAGSGNRGGKGEGVAAAIVALMQGRPEINGYKKPIKIPHLRPPVVGILAGESYKAMALSSVKTMRKILGRPDKDKWKEEHAGNQDYVSLFRIRHKDSREESDWSLLYVFPYDGALPEGGGLDFWWCDEPPPERFLSTLSTRIQSGRLLRQIITATPQEKSKWYPISREFADVSPSGHLTRWPDRKVVGNRMRIKWPSFANEALGPEERKQLEANAKGKPFERSILYGEEVDVLGGNPWPANLLQEALERCKEPLRTETLRIEKEIGGMAISADLQIWEEPVEGEPYYIVGDPAKGIRDGKHDPDGMHVRSRKTRRLVARLNGYLGGWGLGNVMVTVGKRYNNAVLDPLTTGGYGEALLQAIRYRKYTTLARSRVEIRPGEWENRVGTVETHDLRGKIIGAVERELLSGRFDCPSAEVVQCLMDCTVDENGKILASPGSHDEDLICWGRGCVWLDQWKAPEKVKNPITPRIDAIGQWLKKMGQADQRVNERYGNGVDHGRVSKLYDEANVDP